MNVLGDELPPPFTLRALGPHRLCELTRPEDIYQLVLPGTAADFRRSERWRQARPQSAAAVDQLELLETDRDNIAAGSTGR